MRKVIYLIQAIACLLNPKTWGPFVHAWQRTKFDHDFAISFSQGGEDLALLQLLDQPLGRYLDIGAHHPDRFSNTRMLYDRGWSGVNVEANPELITAISKKRPRDITIWACVGSEAEYRFTIFKEPAISTANKEWKEKFLDHAQKIDREIAVKGISLYELIITHFGTGDLDILLIDAEGSDFDVIKSGMFGKLAPALKPEWIVVETSRPVEKALHEDSVQYLENHGYVPYLVLSMSTILKKKK